MSIRSALRMYLVAAGVFLVLDLVWLGLVAQGLYERHLGDLLAEDPNVAAATLFYAILLAGLVYFVIAPAVEQGSPRSALGRGAGFGLVTYATWASPVWRSSRASRLPSSRSTWPGGQCSVPRSAP